jgi:hypothetical protein
MEFSWRLALQALAMNADMGTEASRATVAIDGKEILTDF